MPAWEHTNKWSTATTVEFGLYCATWHVRPTLERLDCADLALNLVIEFACKKGLPVVLAGNYLFDSRVYRGNKGSFLREVLTTIRAEHIPLPTNTRRIGRGQVFVRPGNLLVRVVAGRATHVQVATRASNDQRWVSIVQGNLERSPRVGLATPFTGHLYNFPTEPQVGHYFRQYLSGIRTYSRTGQPEDQNLWASIEVREWNFRGWNKV